MSLARYAPYRNRARYLHELTTLPIPLSLPETVDPARLTVLGRAWINGRRFNLGTLAHAPRLWIAATEPEPAIIGYATGLAAGDPHLWIACQAHRAWAMHGHNAPALKRAAAQVWDQAQHSIRTVRECEG